MSSRKSRSFPSTAVAISLIALALIVAAMPGSHRLLAYQGYDGYDKKSYPSYYNCFGGVPPQCYYCNGMPSPGTVPAGCTFGDSPGWLFGQCQIISAPNYACDQMTQPCGDNRMCADPYTVMGQCLQANIICQN